MSSNLIMSSMIIKQGIKKYTKSLKKEINRCLEANIGRLKSTIKEGTDFLTFTKPNLIQCSTIEYIKNRIVECQNNINNLEKNLKLMDPKVIFEDFLKLKKHPQIVGIEAGKSCLSIYTKRLIVNKKDIGNYQIVLSYSHPLNIHIYNLYGTVGGLHHWFISEGGSPCFAGWKEGIEKNLTTGNLYLAVDTILQFLHSTYHSGKGYYESAERFIKRLNSNDE